MSDLISIATDERKNLSKKLAEPLAALAKANGLTLTEEQIATIFNDANTNFDVPQMRIINPAAIVIEIIIRSYTAVEKGMPPLDFKLRTS